MPPSLGRVPRRKKYYLHEDRCTELFEVVQRLDLDELTELTAMAREARDRSLVAMAWSHGSWREALCRLRCCCCSRDSITAEQERNLSLPEQIYLHQERGYEPGENRERRPTVGLPDRSSRLGQSLGNLEWTSATENSPRSAERRRRDPTPAQAQRRWSSGRSRALAVVPGIAGQSRRRRRNGAAAAAPAAAQSVTWIGPRWHTRIRSATWRGWLPPSTRRSWIEVPSPYGLTGPGAHLAGEEARRWRSRPG